jgi:two-component system chemotaxis sensor kinase CheA
MADMDDVVVEFLVESKEALDQLDRDLVAIEESPSDQQLLARVFRCIHTIKGTTGFLGFKKLEAVSHACESLLARLRDRELEVTRSTIDALLATSDAIRFMVGEIEVSGTDGDKSHDTLLGRLSALTAGEGAPAPAIAPAPAGKMTETSSTTSATAAVPSSPRAIESVRVDVTVLDKLMDLAGELVLARNHIAEVSRVRDASGADLLPTAVQRLHQITKNLQDGIMKMRMQPVDGLFSKLPRMVRDLAAICHKQVRVEFDGRDTELDKTLLESIKDPLTHLLRNAVDHGIEVPKDRLAAGKPAEGKVKLSAYHDGGQVLIDISDDGRGIAVDRVRDRAIERGLLSAEQASRLNENELINLIFLPGFSTAEAVTNVSGRGVGMDIVRNNVEAIGGSIEIRSVRGQGSLVRLRLPLTLAIIPALIVGCGINRYAIPQVSLVELIRVDGSKVETAIETVQSAPVLRLRGRLLPLVWLGTVLGESVEAAQGTGRSLHVVVLQLGARQLGLVVDRIIDSQEIVVKPLVKHLRGLPALAGCTILGDGRVALILDVASLARQAGLTVDPADRALGQLAAAGLRQELDARVLLIVRGPDDSRLAIPLDRVARLEVFDPQRVEQIGGRGMVQYRSGILPLMALEEFLPDRRAEPRNPPAEHAESSLVSVVVFEEETRSFGLIVDDVLDVVDLPAGDVRSPSRPGVEAAVVVNEKITEILDCDYLIRTAIPPPEVQADVSAA